MAHPVTFNLHGIVTIRLLGASEADVATVARQVGPVLGNSSGVPDITIEFVRRLSPANLRFVHPENTSFTDNGDLIVKSADGGHSCAINFLQIGNGCYLRCEQGASSVPFLIAIVALTALAKGYIPLHASAFNYNGTGVLVAGWGKSGKTEALLAFAANGAQYVGDEWILLSRNGRQMFGIPEQVRVWDWQVRQARKLGMALPRPRPLMFTGLRVLLTALRSLNRGAGPPPVSWAKIERALRRQLNVQVPPIVLFPNRARMFTSRADRMFFLITHAAADIAVEAVPALKFADRLATSLRFELSRFFEAYLAYKFAFPGRANRLLEETEDIHRRLLASALEGREILQVLHPYPVVLKDLFRALAPFVSQPLLAHSRPCA